MNIRFSQRLRRANKARGWLICGLDPVLAKLPVHLVNKWACDRTTLIVVFLTAIVDAVAPYVAGFKPNISFFLIFDDEENGKFYGQEALSIICRYIRENYPDHVLILDVKDGDIGASNEGYFKRAIGYGAHALTWDPYLGPAVIDQVNKYPYLGVIVLARTSNSEGTALQNETMKNGLRVFEHNINQWMRLRTSGYEIGFVAGATHPDDLQKIRRKVGATPLLVPGIGKQGGDPTAVVKAGFGGKFGALAINVSSDILNAGNTENFATDARLKAQEYQNTFAQARM